VALTDILTGLYSVISVLAALNHRHRTNEGQHIDLALLDVQVTSLANQNMNFLTSGKPPVRMGNAHPNIVPYQDFPTADGNMIIAVGNDGQFAALCKVLGHPEWATDARFATNTLRVKNRETIIGLLSAATATRTTAEWVKACGEAGVPCGPINDLNAVFDDPQIKARKLKIEMAHPTAGTMPLVGSPINMSATPVAYRSPPPLLGEHTLAVLEEVLGLSRDDVARLAEGRIVQARGLS
jgi:crotonobetainyl-CoA:carnitine CoA-transferase CaiB-like acyl-CoA transferase